MSVYDYADPIRSSPDSWRGRQPKYESLVCGGPTGFALTTKLPSGVAMRVPLGRVRLDSR